MASITGKYILISNDNFDGHLNALGVDTDRINTILSAKPTFEIDFDGAKFTQVTKLDTAKPLLKSVSCILEEEYEQELAFGKEYQQKFGEKAKFVMRRPDENTLVVTLVEGPEILNGLKITRKFSEDGLQMTEEKIGDKTATAIRKFKRI